MNESEALRRRFEHRTEEQLAAARRRLHDKSERIRSAKDRGGVGFDPPVTGGSEVELSDVQIPMVYGDPETLADGLGRMGALRPKGATPVLPRRKP